jgi:hypothetical protein
MFSDNGDHANMLIALTVLSAVVVHIVSPLPSFLEWHVCSVSPILVLSCAAHAIVEEYVFRKLFWSHVAPSSGVHTVLLVWLNVLVFWAAHLVLLARERPGSWGSRVYSMCSYQVSLIFVGLMLNCLYLTAPSHPYVFCVLAHVAFLLLWSLLLGGGRTEAYEKYKLM